jgi:orotate phosphoribosyltransferase
MTDALHSELVALLRARSFRRGTFTLASGRQSSFYVDARPTTMSARGLYLIGSLGLDAIRHAGWRPDLVGGLTLGADPVAYAIALASDRAPPSIDGFTVRKEAKAHGTGRQIEGAFREGARVVVVEDVITTGGSALRAIEVVRQAGAQVDGVLAVVDREEGGMEALTSAGCPAVALVRLQDLIV